MKVTNYEMVPMSKFNIVASEGSTSLQAVISNTCNTIIIREDGTDYLVKDKYFDQTKSESENKERIYSLDFKIISMDILLKVFEHHISDLNNIIEPESNIIIVL